MAVPAFRAHMRAGKGVSGRVLAAATIASIAVAAVGATPVASATGDAWSTFHHDSMHTGVSADATVGAAQASSLQLQWSRPVGGGPIFASPIVARNDTLGKALVYAVSVGGTVRAFTTAGAPVWTSPTNIGSGAVASPVVDGNTLYVGSDNGVLAALDATTGALQCSYQLPVFAPETTPGRIEDSPVVGHDTTGPTVYFGDTGESEAVNHGREWAINGVGNAAGACSLKWMHDLTTAGAKRIGSWSPPALTSDSTGRALLIFGSSQPDDAVYALDARSGAQVWRFQTLKTFADADVGAGPTVSAPGVNGSNDGIVYVDGKDMVEYAIDMLTGQQLWQFDLRADSGHTTNSVSAAALVGGLVVIAYWKYVYAFDALTGAKLWRTVAENGNTLSSVSVSGQSGDQVVLQGDLAGFVYGYRLSDGTRLTTVKVAATRFDASIGVADGMAFIAGEDGNLYALGEIASSGAGSISGTVTDSGSGQPIGGATVSCSVCSPTSVATDGNGIYTVASAPAGSDSVTFSATGYTPQTVAVAVSAGQQTTQNTVLTPSTTHQVVFSDGFESAFSAWTSSTGLSIVSSPVHGGTAAAQHTGTSAGDVSTTLPSSYATAYERVWLWMSSQSNQAHVLQANNKAGIMVVGAYVDRTGILGLQLADGSRHPSPITVAANSWHEVELRFTIGGGTGSADLWFDGVEVLSLTNVNLKNAPVGVFAVGDSGAHTWNAVFDDAAFDTQFIP